jgi:predicted RecA/RadA family phage recombinase
MQATRLKEGRQIDYTPGSAVKAGSVVVIGTLPIIADNDIAANALGALAAEGVYAVAKDTSTFSAGDAVYWNATANPVVGTAGTGAATSTASGANLLGVCVLAALTGDATLNVKLTAIKLATSVGGTVTADDITGSDSSLGITGAAAAASAAGGAIAISGAAGGATTGAGGAVTIAGGAATANNSNGGAVTINGGAKNGTGTDGAITIGTTGTVTFGHNPRIPVATVAVGGTAQGNANAVTEGFTLVTGANNSAAVVLPTTAAGAVCHIKSGTSGSTLQVFPPSGSKINGATANAVYNMANLSLRSFYAYNTTDWFTAAETPT